MENRCSMQSANSCLQEKSGALRLSLVLFAILSAPISAHISIKEMSARSYIALTSLLYAYTRYSIPDSTTSPNPVIKPGEGNIPDWVIAAIYCLGAGCSKGSKATDDESATPENNHNPGADKNSARTNQHSDNHASNDNSGSEPPFKDDESISDAEWALQAFDQLLTEFGELLQLAEKQNIFIVLETDLDDSLLQNPDDNPDFPGDIAHSLEQQRLHKFSHFLNRYPGAVVLVYNTARPALGSINTPAQRFREMGMQRTGYFPKSEEVGILCEPLKSDRPETILPIPDYLILQTGSQVESRFFLDSQAEMQSLNDLIKSWTDQDHKNLQTLKRSIQIDTDYTVEYYKGNSAIFIKPKRPSIAKSWTSLARTLSSLQVSIPDFQVTLTPVLRSDNHKYIYRGVGSLVSVNKGATFRLLLNRMIEKRRQNGMTTRPLVFVFGDSEPDMSMLRPDLEIQAMGSVSQVAIMKRNSRYASAGIDVNDVSWWQQSVYPSNSLLGRGLCGKTVHQALQHHKVLATRGWGITPFLEVAVSSLKQRFAKALNDDIPVPAENF